MAIYARNKKSLRTRGCLHASLSSENCREEDAEKDNVKRAFINLLMKCAASSSHLFSLHKFYLTFPLLMLLPFVCERVALES